MISSPSLAPKARLTQSSGIVPNRSPSKDVPLGSGLADTAASALSPNPSLLESATSDGRTDSEESDSTAYLRSSFTVESLATEEAAASGLGAASTNSTPRISSPASERTRIKLARGDPSSGAGTGHISQAPAP